VELLLKNVLVALVSIIATVLLIDLIARHPAFALRFHSGPASYYYNRFPRIHKTLRHVPDVRLEATVTGDLSWMLGEKSKTRKVLFVTDPLGYRNDGDYRKDHYHTLILGDSFAFAGQTDQKDLLSTKLNKAGYGVYNISADGIGIWSEMVTLKYEILFNLKTKGPKRVIWLLFEGNDLEGDFYSETDPASLLNNKLKEISVSLENYYKRSLIKLMIKRVFSRDRTDKPPVVKRNFFGDQMLFYESYVEMLKMNGEDIARHENFNDIDKSFKIMRDFTAKFGFDLICVVIPMKTRVYEWVLNNKTPWSSEPSQSAFARYIQSLCKRNKLDFIDLTPIFIDRSRQIYENRQNTIYWLDDTHWNDEGQAIAAVSIDEYLKGQRRGK